MMASLHSPVFDHIVYSLICVLCYRKVSDKLNAVSLEEIRIIIFPFTVFLFKKYLLTESSENRVWYSQSKVKCSWFFMLNSPFNIKHWHKIQEKGLRRRMLQEGLGQGQGRVAVRVT